MEFKRKFGKRKTANPKKGLFLVILLMVAVLLWYKAESIIAFFF